jgi:hypothetical protein
MRTQGSHCFQNVTETSVKVALSWENGFVISSGYARFGMLVRGHQRPAGA